MTGRTNISQAVRTKGNSLGIALLWCVLSLVIVEHVSAQVIANNGAIMTVASGTVLNGGNIENTTGTISNAGTISLTSTYTNGGTTDGNGTYDIAGNLTISAGTFDLGTGTANRSSVGGVLSLSSGATLKIGGSSGGMTGSNFPNNFTTLTLSGTVEFNGTGAQTVPGIAYYHLTFANAGSKQLDAAATAAGNVTVNIGATFVVSGTASIQVTGSISNDGAITNSGSITVGP